MTTSSVKPSQSTSSVEAPPHDGNVDEMTPAIIKKRDSEEDEWASTGYNYINPFVHKLQIVNRLDMAKIYVLTVLLVPFRVLGCVFCLFSAWVFSYIGLYNMTLDDIRAKPISGWRRLVQRAAALCMRLVFASGSFHYIEIKGKRASPKQAPVLVVAPHSSYVDSIIVVCQDPPAVVAKQDTAEIPFLGKIINYAQPIYVRREDPNSRQNTIREIVERARSPEEWSQVCIFPEGTCTNRKALIKFKPGAFYAGVPVQPVIIRYPNKHDTCTWTWEGPGAVKLLWYTMAQFYTRCEIEFLPVYNPSEEEQKDANLYARNVQQLMANALGVPNSDYSFEDVILMSRAKEMRIPFPGDIVEIERKLNQMGLLQSDIDAKLIADFLSMPNTDEVNIKTFSELLKIDLNDPHLHQLFSLLDHSHSGTISLKSFLLCSLFCKLKNEETIKFLRAVINIYAESSQAITRENLCQILRHSRKITPDKSNEIYFAIDESHKGTISFADFERYIQQCGLYCYLYEKREHIRRAYDKKE